jgi:hypothetical protein
MLDAFPENEGLKIEMTTETKTRTFDSLKAAAAAMKLPMRLLKAAKAAGCPAFRSNRVYEAELIEWIANNPEAAEMAGDDPRDEKLREEIRKLRIANDAKEGRLIERAWVAERMQRAAGALNAFRAKSEAEHPTRFAAAAGDVAECRTELRKIWDEIFRDIETLKECFRDEP